MIQRTINTKMGIFEGNIFQSCPSEKVISRLSQSKINKRKEKKKENNLIHSICESNPLTNSTPKEK